MSSTPPPPSALVLTGSARRDSYTRRLGAVAAAATPSGELAPRLTVLPYFDQDLESTPPAEVEALRAQVAAADAVIVVTPEHNGTIPGQLGDAIDWLSRPYAAGALPDKAVLAVAASPGGVGGRAVVALRTVLGNAGAQLIGPPLTVDLVLAEELASPLDHAGTARAAASGRGPATRR